MSDGYIDTNVFLHALGNDSHSAECKAFLAQLRSGTVRARLEPLVLHELSYALPRFKKQYRREDVVNHLLGILELPGIVADKEILAETFQRWGATPGLGFVDAYLVSVARRDEAPVFSKNTRELVAQGATVPDPLADASSR